MALRPFARKPARRTPLVARTSPTLATWRAKGGSAPRDREESQTLPEKSLAAVKVGPSTTELREVDVPEIADDAALLKMEVAGVCGTDVSQYKLPLRGAPLIMGHENVGYLAKVGRLFARDKGFKEGD